MVIKAFISIIFDQVTRMRDAQIAEKKQDELVISTVKEALLGCCVDCRTCREFTSFDESDAKLRRYTEMLNVVSVRFRVYDMRNSPLCERIWGILAI